MALGYTWTVNRDDVINSALRKIGVVGIGETAETEMITNAALALNAMLKEWSGLHSAPWRILYEEFTTTINQQTISFASITYSMSILKATISKSSDRNIVTQLPLVESSDYLPYLEQTTEYGEPCLAWARPTATRSSISALYLYPIPDAVYYIDAEILMPLKEFGASSDNMEMSSSWANALIYGLAANLSHEYSCPMNERVMMRQEAERALSNAKLSTVEQPTYMIRKGAY